MAEVGHAPRLPPRLPGAVAIGTGGCAVVLGPRVCQLPGTESTWGRKRRPFRFKPLRLSCRSVTWRARSDMRGWGPDRGASVSLGEKVRQPGTRHETRKHAPAAPSDACRGQRPLRRVLRSARARDTAVIATRTCSHKAPLLRDVPGTA